MSSEIMHQILQPIEEEMTSSPSAIEFEMAYQARVAIDRIRFAITHVEKFGKPCDQMREAGLQLCNCWTPSTGWMPLTGAFRCDHGSRTQTGMAHQH